MTKRVIANSIGKSLHTLSPRCIYNRVAKDVFTLLVKDVTHNTMIEILPMV